MRKRRVRRRFYPWRTGLLDGNPLDNISLLTRLEETFVLIMNNEVIHKTVL